MKGVTSAEQKSKIAKAGCRQIEVADSIDTILTRHQRAHVTNQLENTIHNTVKEAYD